MSGKFKKRRHIFEKKIPEKRFTLRKGDITEKDEKK